MTATSPGAITLGARTNPGKPALRHICAIRADLGAALEFETAQGTVRAMFCPVGRILRCAVPMGPMISRPAIACG